MSFWSSEKLKEVLSEGKLIEPYDNEKDQHSIKYGAYELSLGSEAYITSYEDNKKKTLNDGEQLVIPPGQFGLLLTEEKVTIPTNAIGFISIKAGTKFRGLVNVSGFHVDPGFSGKLKFSVYNAGSRDIVLQRKRRLFLLWLSDLDRPTQPYAGNHAYQSEITPEDVMQIAGKIASPGQLQKEIQELKVSFNKDIQTLTHKLDNIKWVLTALLSVATGLAVFSLRGCVPIDNQNSHESKTTNSIVQVTNIADTQPKTTGK
jgi:dCTP deaminase